MSCKTNMTPIQKFTHAINKMNMDTAFKKKEKTRFFINLLAYARPYVTDNYSNDERSPHFKFGHIGENIVYPNDEFVGMFSELLETIKQDSEKRMDGILKRRNISELVNSVIGEIPDDVFVLGDIIANIQDKRPEIDTTKMCRDFCNFARMPIVDSNRRRQLSNLRSHILLNSLMTELKKCDNNQEYDFSIVDTDDEFVRYMDRRENIVSSLAGKNVSANTLLKLCKKIEKNDAISSHTRTALKELAYKEAFEKKDFAPLFEDISSNPSFFSTRRLEDRLLEPDIVNPDSNEFIFNNESFKTHFNTMNSENKTRILKELMLYGFPTDNGINFMDAMSEDKQYSTFKRTARKYNQMLRSAINEKDLKEVTDGLREECKYLLKNKRQRELFEIALNMN